MKVLIQLEFVKIGVKEAPEEQVQLEGKAIVVVRRPGWWSVSLIENNFILVGLRIGSFGKLL